MEKIQRIQTDTTMELIFGKSWSNEHAYEESKNLIKVYSGNPTTLITVTFRYNIRYNKRTWLDKILFRGPTEKKEFKVDALGLKIIKRGRIVCDTPKDTHVLWVFISVSTENEFIIRNPVNDEGVSVRPTLAIIDGKKRHCIEVLFSDLVKIFFESTEKEDQ